MAKDKEDKERDKIGASGPQSGSFPGSSGIGAAATPSINVSAVTGKAADYVNGGVVSYGTESRSASTTGNGSSGPSGSGDERRGAFVAFEDAPPADSCGGPPGRDREKNERAGQPKVDVRAFLPPPLARPVVAPPPTVGAASTDAGQPRSQSQGGGSAAPLPQRLAPPPPSPARPVAPAPVCPQPAAAPPVVPPPPVTAPPPPLLSVPLVAPNQPDAGNSSKHDPGGGSGSGAGNAGGGGSDGGSGGGNSGGGSDHGGGCGNDRSDDRGGGGN